MTQVPAPIQAMIDATNAGDHEAFVAAFTPDAVLVDWGKEFDGAAGIAAWDDSDNIGRGSRFHVAAGALEGDTWVLTLDVSGGGFNGTSDFRFELDGDLIRRMEIQP
jgi:ketosteroid isomerase-like protein